MAKHVVPPIGITEVTNHGIGLLIPENGMYDLSVYSLNGRLIMRKTQMMNAGQNIVKWNGQTTAFGVMIAKIAGAKKGVVATKKFSK
jgi:hypothetical protein